jgi:hypothetical protein
MKRFALSCLVSIAVLASPSLAQASDSSLEHALAGYESKLTSDIGYLASFSTPSRSGAAGALSRLSGVQRDLEGASKAASGQQASSSAGRKGRALVLSALGDALTAAGDARAAADAAHAGKSAAARGDAGKEQSAIDQAIPRFEQGGSLLHLT